MAWPAQSSISRTVLGNMPSRWREREIPSPLNSVGTSSDLERRSVDIKTSEGKAAFSFNDIKKELGSFTNARYEGCGDGGGELSSA